MGLISSLKSNLQMLDKLPAEIVCREICGKHLGLYDTIQVGIALGERDQFYNPEKVYPRRKWLERGYDLQFYNTLMDCLINRKTLADKCYKSELVIEQAYSTVEKIGFKKDVQTLDILKNTFQIEKLIQLSFIRFQDTRFPIIQT